MTAAEVITHSLVRDIGLPSGRTLALITLHNNTERPTTLGPAGLTELGAALDALADRAATGGIHAVAVTGTQGVLAAGADLTVLNGLGTPDRVQEFTRLGHRVFGSLANLPVPSFCFVNGVALGGGLELALHATYRTVSATSGAIGLPEVSLGLVPGWGGTTLLPNLIGVANALDVVLWNPLRQNRTLTPQQAFDYGISDVIFPAVRFLEDSLRWADAVLDGSVSIERPHRPEALTRVDSWLTAIDTASLALDDRYGRVPKAPWAALDLLSAAVDGDRDAGCAREDRVFPTLAAGDQFAASAYAYDLTRQRGKRPIGAPDSALATPLSKVGVIGAGLMARQFALLFLRKLQIPVLITDLDQERVDAAVADIHAELAKQHAAGRIDSDHLNRLCLLLRGTTDLTEYADCTLVIEAVFEDLAVKHQVFSSIEQFVGPETVLATNTSSLSVEQISAPLAHPHRLVGIHFFNPVAAMPLVEIIRTPHTSDASLATVFTLANALGKSAVMTADTPGFVVNRLLAIVMGEAMYAVDVGTPLTTVERALTPLGLPMTPFGLIDLAGWKVSAHVLDTMAAAFPDRFPISPNLHRLADLPRALERDKNRRITGWSTDAQAVLTSGRTPLNAEQIQHRVEDALATEIALMLAEGVVPAAADIDLCLILGAGWPLLDGGITPYLDREGASQRVAGDTFHHPPIVGIGATADAQPRHCWSVMTATLQPPSPTPDYQVTGRQGTDYYRVFDDIPAADREIWDRAKGFIDQAAPLMADAWDTARYPLDLVHRLGELDLLTDGVVHPLLSVVSPLAAGLINMEISRGDGSLGTVIGVQAGLALRTLGLLGSPVQQQRWLGPLAKAEVLGAFALTEPDHGSDSVALETSARRHRDGWILRGSKKWIGNGASGGITFVWARVDDPAAGDHGKVRCFLVPQETPGYRGEVIPRKASLRAIHQATITLDDVHLPADAVLPGSSSFKDAATVLLATRAGVAWSALGHATACYEASLAYAKQRHQFGRPLAGFQLVQERLTRMLAELTSMQLHCRRIADLDTAGTLSPTQASLAKYYNTRAARRVAATARDLLGGNGILLDYGVAQHMADIESIHTYEGTESIQALLIGRDLTGHSAFT